MAPKSNATLNQNDAVERPYKHESGETPSGPSEMATRRSPSTSHGSHSDDIIEAESHHIDQQVGTSGAKSSTDNSGYSSPYLYEPQGELLQTKATPMQSKSEFVIPQHVFGAPSSRRPAAPALVTGVKQKTIDWP